MAIAMLGAYLAEDTVMQDALRAVPVPAGTHQVELRYEPPLLRLGLGISLGTVGAVIVGAAVLRRREGHRAASGENE